MQIVRFYGSKTKVTKSFSFSRCRGHRLTITAADKFKNPSRSFTDFRVCA